MASLMGGNANPASLLSRTPTTQRKRGRPKKDRKEERQQQQQQQQQQQTNLVNNQNLTQELLAQAMMTQNPLLALGGMSNDALLAQAALMVSSAPNTSTSINSNLFGGGDMSNLLAAISGGTDDATKQLFNSLTGNTTVPTTTMNFNQANLQLPREQQVTSPANTPTDGNKPDTDKVQENNNDNTDNLPVEQENSNHIKDKSES